MSSKMSSKMNLKIMYFLIFRKDRFWSNFGIIWGPFWSPRGAPGSPLGCFGRFGGGPGRSRAFFLGFPWVPWPLLELSGGARGAFTGPFLGHACPPLVAMLNKVAPKRNACAHPAKSSARSKNTLSVHLLSRFNSLGAYFNFIFGVYFRFHF